MLLPRFALMVGLGSVWLPAGPPTANAQSAAITDDEVDELIEHLIVIIKDRQHAYSVMRVSGPIKLASTGEIVRVDRAFKGTVVSK